MSPRARTALAIAALLLPQLALVLRAQARPDRAFGFSMFPESSWVQYTLLWRATDGHETPLPHGCFPGGPCISEVTRRRDLQLFDQQFVAPYGQRAVIHRMHVAMGAFSQREPTREGTLVLRAAHATNLGPEAQTEIEVRVKP